MSTSNLSAYLERNARFVTDGKTDVSEIPCIPFRQDYLITCIDPRTEPAAAVGLELGETIVARYTRGRVTPSIIKERTSPGSATSARTRPPDADRFEVTIIHHTDCGSAPSADEELRRSFAAQGGYDEQTHQAPTQTGAIIRAVKTSFADGLSQASVMCAVVVCVGALPAPRCLSINPESKQVTLIPEMTRTRASSLSPEPIRLGNQEPELTQADSSTSSPSSSTTPIPADDPNRHSLWLAPNKTRPR